MDDRASSVTGAKAAEQYLAHHHAANDDDDDDLDAALVAAMLEADVRESAVPVTTGLQVMASPAELDRVEALFARLEAGDALAGGGAALPERMRRSSTAAACKGWLRHVAAAFLGVARELDAGGAATIGWRHEKMRGTLWSACFLGAAGALPALLKAADDLDARDGDGFAPLHYAAYAGDARAVRSLVDAGADAGAAASPPPGATGDAADFRGAAPLHVAACRRGVRPPAGDRRAPHRGRGRARARRAGRTPFFAAASLVCEHARRVASAAGCALLEAGGADDAAAGGETALAPPRPGATRAPARCSAATSAATRTRPTTRGTRAHARRPTATRRRSPRCSPRARGPTPSAATAARPRRGGRQRRGGGGPGPRRRGGRGAFAAERAAWAALAPAESDAPPAAAPAHAWTDDAASPKCLLCDFHFTLVHRRHHCRFCGILCCGACSSKKCHLRAPPPPDAGPTTGARGGERRAAPEELEGGRRRRNAAKLRRLLQQAARGAPPRRRAPPPPRVQPAGALAEGMEALQKRGALEQLNDKAAGLECAAADFRANARRLRQQQEERGWF
ncbi:hypothetical protein JL722_11943 [Aureococcus anophagefferens]|nr:hypothetical protein JL722_11943 [Aureococcus anophagefferens]